LLAIIATVCGNLNNVDRLIGEVRRVRVPLENMSITVHFRDREHEIRKFLTSTLKSRGVSLIFGPRGAGKSTFVKVLSDAMRRVGGFDDIAFIRYTFGEEMLRETRVNIPGLGIDVIQELEGVANINLSMDPLSLSMNLVKPILILARAVRSYGLRDKRIVVVYDDIDRFLRKYGYEVLDAVANKIPDVIREHDVWVKALFMVSDQAAVNMAMRVSPKGGMRPYLLWNLPRSAFGEVVNEIAELTGAKNIDTELLWNLLGGNVRELEILVNNYGWDISAWLREVIRRVITAFEKYVGPGSFLSIDDALRWLVGKGRVAARDYGLGEFTGQPDAVEGVLGLLEENVMIYVGLPGLEALSELPNEPWIGKRYAYQIPAYHWVMRVMIESKSVGIDAEHVLKAMSST